MKKLSGLFTIAALLVLSGCFDTVQESTINDDGSGLFVSTMDMGKLLGMVKMVAGEKEGMKEMDKMKKDTTIYLKDIRDSIPESDNEYAGRNILNGVFISLFSTSRPRCYQKPVKENKTKCNG